MKYKLEATIPVTSYGNIRPTYEVEGDGEEEVKHLKRLWSRFGESKLTDKFKGGKRIETWTEEVVLFNEVTHTYTDLKGNVLLSGSKYADKVIKPFDMENILPKASKSWGVDEDTVRKIWSIKGDIATSYGTAVHAALEAYHLYEKVGSQISEKKKIEENYILPSNKHIADLVLDFKDKFGVEAMTEVVVSDVANGMAGTIDRLQPSEDGYIIGDYKTNTVLSKEKVDRYQLQLSFYAQILLNKGHKVKGLELYYITDNGWEKKELDILPLDLSE